MMRERVHDEGGMVIGGRWPFNDEGHSRYYSVDGICICRRYLRTTSTRFVW